MKNPRMYYDGIHIIITYPDNRIPEKLYLYNSYPEPEWWLCGSYTNESLLKDSMNPKSGIEFIGEIK